MLLISFFKTIFKKSKILFLGIIIYILGITYTGIAINQISPFYVWGMYATPTKSKDEYSFTQITYNNEIIDNFPVYMDFKKGFYNYPLYTYLSYEKFSNHESFNKNALNKLGKYPNLYERIISNEKDWERYFIYYKDFLEVRLKNKANSILIEEIKINYQENGKSIKKGKRTLYEYSK